MKRVHIVNESKWDYFKTEVHNKFDDVKIWCYNNRVILIRVGLSVAVSAGPFIIKKSLKMRELKKAENIKNLYCYDRSLGHYWKLKRELTNDEWVYIDKRKAQGERLADILDELKVLK